ncbi:MAG: hypothetical protein IJF16_00800 [Clostridia bacterium]|nr:hypothetical protein [Clostridia bacterium]
MEMNKLKEIVEELVYAADEIKNQNHIDEINYGKLLAYAEALSVIRDICDEDEKRAIGLMFDIDERYLCGD